MLQSVADNQKKEFKESVSGILKQKPLDEDIEEVNQKQSAMNIGGDINIASDINIRKGAIFQPQQIELQQIELQPIEEQQIELQKIEQLQIQS